MSGTRPISERWGAKGRLGSQAEIHLANSQDETLNVKEGMWEPRQFDSLSNALLVNHNIWTHLDAFSRANDLVANGNSQALPPEFRQCIDLIHELFEFSDAIKASYELEKHLKLLDSIAPMTM